MAKRRGPLYVGIDPGKEGFLCVVDADGRVAAMWRLPYLDNRPDQRRIRKLFAALKRRDVRYIVLEEQHAFPREGAVGAFTNGVGFGTLLNCLAWTDIPHKTSQPSEWKRLMKIPVPKIPKPKLPKKPATKAAEKRWKKQCEKLRAKHSRQTKGKRKAYACRLAQQLEPTYDFRLSPRHRGPHDGKCEAFLIARLALELGTRT